MRANQVKRALAAGERSFGTMIFEFPTTGIGRIAAEAGAEFVIYDMEHTGWSIETIRGLMASSRAPISCRWSVSRPRNITSSRGRSTSGRWD
jgi:2-keto-3-deoxy-L-rhamnonate aldolase RhmA